MTVRFLKRARQELASQLARLASVSPDAAMRLLAEVDHALTLLDNVAVDGVELTLVSERRVREWLVPPLALFYIRRADTVVVLRVRHGAQHPIARG